jgi:hypothetical protein
MSRPRLLAAAVLVSVLATALWADDAHAANCGKPSISGSAEVGGTLTAEAGACTDPFPPNVELAWYRCTGATAASCGAQPVKAAQSSPSSYTPTSSDVGSRLGVKQTASGGLPPFSDEDWEFTGVVPQPTSSPPPPPPPPGGGGGGSAAPLLSPFPIVTIAGRLIRRGARLTRLSVRGPSASDVRVRCRGRSCRRRSARATIGPRGSVRIPRFQRRFRAGTVLEVLVTKPGFVGKYTRFRIRRRRPPLRTDLCVQPGATTGSACPA